MVECGSSAIVSSGRGTQSDSAFGRRGGALLPRESKTYVHKLTTQELYLKEG